MTVYRGICISLLVSCTLLLSGCRRSCGDVWEDTKTCGRHMGRGVASLFGKHPASARPCTSQDFASVEENDYIPFSDEDLYRGIMRGDELALMKIDADTPIPQSRVSPGEIGSPIPGLTAFHDPKTGEQVAIFKNLHFDTDDYVIRSPESWDIVRRIASYMRERPNLYVFIEGHCDERGPAAYNLALGTRRANAVRNALVKEGVSPDRLLTVSYGKERPLQIEHHAAAWKANRRGQFKLYDGEGAPLCAR